MSAKPFDTRLVIARMQPLVATNALRKIGTRGDYANVRSLQDFPAPCAYVMLARERGQTTKTGASFPGRQSKLAQLMNANFGVVMAFRNHRGLEGDELRDELSDQIGEVRERILGWTPEVAGGRACQLVQGDLTDYDHATAIWTDVWNTQHIIQPENPS